ncbi:MAG: Ger(x)C family spore germination C-terminal domain-containing protein [Clostridiaceae bacterium]
MKNRFLIILLFLFMSYFLITGRKSAEPIEDLLIQPGVGYDIEKTSSDTIKYNIPVSTYVFEGDGNISSEVYSGSYVNLAGTRTSRQVKLNKRFIVAFEKIYIFSEDFAKRGIRNGINILFKNPWVDDMGNGVVCAGKAEDILKFNVKGYPSSCDYIEGMIKSIKYYNFFSDNYTLVNMEVMLDSEGRNLTLPYIEIIDGQLEITGLAVFKGDKMIAKMDLEDSQILNILRENNDEGILYIQGNNDESISYDATVNKKVKCIKQKDNYKFIISLDFNGSIVEDELYKNITKSSSVGEEFSQDISKVIKQECDGFIYNMQNTYKVDMLDLGRIAAAKYGRHTGVDWNDEVSKADIEVNIKANLTSFGRGDY